MNKRIIFQPPGAPVAILTPLASDLTHVEIGRKDVPAGLPFWIVEAADLPEERNFRSAWELDEESLGEPSGFGGAA